MGAGLSVEDHLARAAEHRRVGEALAGAPHEWAAVCYFYAGYHIVRHALRTDPVFDDPMRLSRINAALTPQDRDCERHHGRRRPPREWGVNELVRLLYPEISLAYETLHQASIAVRYQGGLGEAAAIGRLLLKLDEIESAHTDGRLIAPVGG